MSSSSSRHEEAAAPSNPPSSTSNHHSSSSSSHSDDNGDNYSSDYISDIATESTVVCEPVPVDERQRLIESYAQFKKTRGKLEVYASDSTQFTPDPARKISTTKVHGLVQRLYRPHLLLQRTKEDMRRRKEEVTVENFDSVNDKHLAKYWSHRRQVEAKQAKRRECLKNKSASTQKEAPTTPSSATKETSNPRGNDAATPAPRPRCLPAIVAQEGDSSIRLIVANGGRTLLLQDDTISDHSDSITDASMHTPSIADSTTSGGRESTAPQGKVSQAELSSLWLLADPPSELAPTVRGLSITDANTMGVDLSWMAVHKREVHRLKDDLPSPHRFGRKKYQLKCQREGGSTSLTNTPSKGAAIGSTRELVEDFVDKVINGALEVSAAGAELSPTKSTVSCRSTAKGPSGLRVTLLDIQLEASEESNINDQSKGSQGEVVDTAPERINSPRSCLVMLRNGIALSDLTPTPFAVFVKEGTLVGVPKFASEKRYLSKESKRRQLLRRLQTEYSALCGEASRDEFMDMLMASKPGAVVEDTSAFAQIIDYKRSRQQESAARYADKLDNLVQMTKNKCIKIKAQNDKLQQFEAARVARWREETEERERQRELKAIRLQCVREDAKEIANLQRNGLLTKLDSEEERRKKMDLERRRQRHVESETQKEDADTKRKQQMRHTRLEELKRAQAADRIRQKMAKIDRQKKMSEELLKQMRYEQEMAKLRDELTRKAAEEDILAYRRKHQV